MERPLSHRLRSFPKPLSWAHYPPKCDVHRRDPQCPVHVDSGRLLHARSSFDEQVKSTRPGGQGIGQEHAFQKLGDQITRKLTGCNRGVTVTADLSSTVFTTASHNVTYDILSEASPRPALESAIWLAAKLAETNKSTEAQNA